MDQLVRRINAQYKLNLSEDEIQQLAREAIAMEEVLRPLYEVDLGQLRPVVGIVKKPYERRRTRGAK
jgi:uncharacterized protein YpuA (DUF1002 family)